MVSSLTEANNFDEVLRHVGECGKFQKRLLFIMFVASYCVTIQNMSPVFTMKIPRHRCKIKGLENDTYGIQNHQHARLVNLSVPFTEGGDYETCVMYDVVYGANLSSGKRKVKCDDWVYDKSEFESTYVTELDLVCQRTVYRSHSTMLMFAGKFVGAAFNSLAGDSFGRRPVYAVMVVAMTGTGVGLMFVSSLPALMLLRFLAGATTTGCYLSVYLIALEMVGTAQRSVVSVVGEVSGLTAYVLAGVFAFLLRDWQSFQACLAAPCLLTLAGYLMLIVMCMYGLNLNVSTMRGDLFVNYAAITLVKVVSVVVFAAMRERVGRRLFLLFAAGVGGVACLSAILPTLLGGDDWIMRGLSFLGKMCVTTALSCLFVLTPELFPTPLRSFGLGSCSMMSSLGGLAAPYVADLNILVSGQWGPALPQVVFGVAGIANAIMVFFLPETRGRTLPETVRDAEIFGRSKVVTPTQMVAFNSQDREEEMTTDIDTNDTIIKQ